MKIGLLGGSFNPIHNGHLALADEARMQFNLDEIWFIPAGNPYQKDQKDMLPANVRSDLVLEAVGSLEWANVWLGEIYTDKPSYTAETLARIKNEHPEHEYFLIVGADAFKQINISWHSPQYIFDNCTIIVAFRSDQSDIDVTHQIALEYEHNWGAKVLELPFYNQLSSTWIRAKVRDKQSYRFDVPYCVYYYIEHYHPWGEMKDE